MIIPGCFGENVYPAQVETVIMKMGGVSGVCVFGVPDAKWGEAIKAVLELKNPARYSAEQVIDFVGSQIARFKRPHSVAFTDVLPRSAQGAVRGRQVQVGKRPVAGAGSQSHDVRFGRDNRRHCPLPIPTFW